ncbi:MAG: hypothetical protein AAF654_03655 [Myxococcota bacterium]
MFSKDGEDGAVLAGGANRLLSRATNGLSPAQMAVLELGQIIVRGKAVNRVELKRALLYFQPSNWKAR